MNLFSRKNIDFFRFFLGAFIFLLSRIFFFRYSKKFFGKTRVIIFHHIDDKNKFARLIKFLSKRYNIISFSDYQTNKKSANKINLIISMDDGYSSWHSNALDILQKFEIQPMLFIDTSFISLPVDTSSKYCLDIIRTWPEKSITWSQLQDFQAIGADIFSHGSGHHNSLSVSHHIFRKSLSDSKFAIKKNLGIESDIFAYPYGIYNENIFNLLTSANYRFAFSTDSGFLEDSNHQFSLRRTNLGMRSNLIALAIVEGWPDLLSYNFKKIKHFLNAYLHK